MNKWEYVSNEKGCDSTAQVSPDGKYLLLKEYESTKDGVKRTYRIEYLKNVGRKKDK